MGFALFFLAEYSNIIITCVLSTIVYFGGWTFFLNAGNSLFFVLKILFLLIVFIWVRTTFPRFRYDQLMHLGWKIFLPLSLAFLLINLIISFFFII